MGETAPALRDPWSERGRTPCPPILGSSQSEAEKTVLRCPGVTIAASAVLESSQFEGRQAQKVTHNCSPSKVSAKTQERRVVVLFRAGCPVPGASLGSSWVWGGRVGSPWPELPSSPRPFRGRFSQSWKWKLRPRWVAGGVGREYGPKS